MAYTSLLFIDHSLLEETTRFRETVQRAESARLSWAHSSVKWILRTPIAQARHDRDSESGGGAGANRSGRGPLRAREVRPIEWLQRRFPLACQGVRSRGHPELPSGLTAPCEDSNPTRELGQV